MGKKYYGKIEDPYDMVNKQYVDNLGVPYRYEGNILGDGSSTEFEIEHNLGCIDANVLVLDGNKEDTNLTIIRNSGDKFTLIFEEAPAVGENYRVYINGYGLYFKSLTID